jgi:hypothetical protein
MLHPATSAAGTQSSYLIRQLVIQQRDVRNSIDISAAVWDESVRLQIEPELSTPEQL